MTMSPLAPELIQFPHSHYNEKARWALDWKRVSHTRRSLLPGPHALTVRRLTGATQVPVLRVDGEVVAGSARIVEALERRHPDPPLYPSDPEQRRRALEIQTWFDEEVGPRVRQAIFAVFLDEPAYVVRLFASERPPWVRALYRASLPVVRLAMKRSMGLDAADAVPRAHATTREALDFVAKHAGPEGYLVGDRFSVADLAAASLLAPITSPPDSPMARPEPMPDAFCRLMEGWADHPGVAWVLERYRSDRPRSAEIRFRAGD